MKDKTFADYLIRHGVKFPEDTVVINIGQLSTLKASSEKIWDDIRQGISRPLFDNQIVEVHSREQQLYAGLLIQLCETSEDAMYYDVRWFVLDNNRLEMSKSELETYQLKFDSEGRFLEFAQYCFGIGIESVLHATIHAMSLIHQKAECELITYPHSVIRNIKRKTGKGPSPYFMLKIDPTKPSNRYVSSARETGQKNSEHLVRGHFRRVEDHPLPQFNGTFWIPSHIRGNKENGEIAKGYKIVLPDTK